MAAGKRLKVFRLHSGFYDMIVAAPSQMAALAAWGAQPHEFAHGFAAVTDDPAAVKAAMANPGVVLKRQFGSKDTFLAETPALSGPKVSAAQKVRAKAEARKKENARKAEQKKREQDAVRKANAKRKQRLQELEESEAAIRKERLSLERELKRPAKRSR